MTILNNDNFRLSSQRSLPCISRIKIENFKALEKVDVDTSWLTVVVGANSAGKSSLIQALLMLAQSIDDAEPGFVNLNSEVMQLGTAGEVLRRLRPNKPKTATSLHIGISLGNPSAERDSGELNLGEVEFTLTPEAKLSTKDSYQIRLELQALQSTSMHHGTAGFADKMDLVLLRDVSDQAKYPVYRVQSKSSKISRTVGASKSNVNSMRRSIFSADFYIGKSANRGRVGSLPASALIVGDLRQYLNFSLGTISYLARRQSPVSKGTDKRSVTTLISEFAAAAKETFNPVEIDGRTIYFPLPNSALLGSPRMRDLLISLSAKLRQKDGTGLRQISKSQLPKTGEAELTFAFEINQQLDFRGGTEVTSYLSSRVRYLGPLREREHSPGLALSFQRNAIIPLGVKGEKMAEFLMRTRSAVSSYPRIDGSTERSTLIEATNHWLKSIFNFEDELSVDNEGINGPVARLGRTRFQHLGTGISQLMPVIVLALSSQPGTTLILEQPELHLHPAMQQRLADFFVHMARSKRQIILETQSEYILTRIRRHLADGALKPTDTAVLFATRGEITSRRIQADGNLEEEWPEDFFDFTMEDTIALMNASDQA